MESLRGKLLIASPELSDYFRRTVVLVIEHTDEGAMGVVLNRPSDAPVMDAVPQLAELAGADDVVHIGGPVSPESVIALGAFDAPEEAARQVVGDLGLLDPDGPDPELRGLRVYAGYAGWGPAQLESELEVEAWIVEDADAHDPFLDEDAWPAVLERKGGPYAFLATMPADPSMN